MNLSEAEKRMIYQVEGTSQGAALNEIYMTWRYAPDKAMKDTAEKLLFVGRIMSSSQKTAIPLLDSSALANIAMTNSRTPEKFLLFIFYRSITEKALGIA